MKRIQPSYYSQFSCLADSCPDACCYGWEVEIDDAHAAWYAALEGPLGDTLRSALYCDDGTYYLRNHHSRCPMWRRDGLCALQAQLGHDALSQVCQSYPRIQQDYGSFLELGLEMSCPQAARLMLSGEPMVFSSQEIPGGEAGDYDQEWMDILQRSRPVAMALLDTPGYSLPQRLALLLMYGYHIQAQLDGMAPGDFSAPEALAEAQSFAGQGNFPAFLGFYQTLEILTDSWRSRLASCGKTPQWSEMLVPFARYGLYRYYLQAVSDGDLVGRIKMILCGCILCAYLGVSVETIQHYAKEIENDADNVDALLDGAYTHPALTDRNLLGLLLA